MRPVHTKLPVEDWPGPPSVYSVPVYVDRRSRHLAARPVGAAATAASSALAAADKAPTQDSTCSPSLITVPDFTGMNAQGGAVVRQQRRRRDGALRPQPGRRRRGAGHRRGPDARPARPHRDRRRRHGHAGREGRRGRGAARDEHDVRPGRRRPGHHAAARPALPRRGVGRRDEGGRVPAGTVIDQSPAQGTLAAAGSVVVHHRHGRVHRRHRGARRHRPAPRTAHASASSRPASGVRARRDGGTPRDDDVVYTMDPDVGSIVPPETVVQLITDSRTVADRRRPRRRLSSLATARPLPAPPGLCSVRHVRSSATRLLALLAGVALAAPGVAAAAPRPRGRRGRGDAADGGDADGDAQGRSPSLSPGGATWPSSSRSPGSGRAAARTRRRSSSPALPGWRSRPRRSTAGPRTRSRPTPPGR